MLYLTFDRLPVFVPLRIIGLYRYCWFTIRVLAYVLYRPIPVPDNPSYIASEDVTSTSSKRLNDAADVRKVIVPTIDSDAVFVTAAQSWLAGRPREIIIVTEERMREPLERLAEEIAATYHASAPDTDGYRCRISVRTVPKASKRLQMAEGVRAAKTDIIVFADDDALWPPTMLPLILACFEDQQVGGVGTSQVVKPCGRRMTVWEVLAAFRLTVRNIEIAASTHIDQGVPCLSGRTAAYRSIILQQPDFLHSFTNDYWRGKYLLNSGDDKFLTRWLVSHGWTTYVQCLPGAELQSTMKPDWRFLKQVLRWTRNTWRSDLRSVFMERHILVRHPYTAYGMIDKFLNPFTLLAGPALIAFLTVRSMRDPGSATHHLPAWNILLSWAVWLLATRALKLAPHFWHRPKDIVYLPCWILFGYFFAVMKIYALLTLHKTGWGTREGVDDQDPAPAPRELAADPDRPWSEKLDPSSRAWASPAPTDARSRLDRGPSLGGISAHRGIFRSTPQA